AEADFGEPREPAVAAVRDEYGDADAQGSLVRVIEPLVDLVRRAVRIERQAHAQPFVPVAACDGTNVHAGGALRGQARGPSSASSLIVRDAQASVKFVKSEAIVTAGPVSIPVVLYGSDAT